MDLLLEEYVRAIDGPTTWIVRKAIQGATT